MKYIRTYEVNLSPVRRLQIKELDGIKVGDYVLCTEFAVTSDLESYELKFIENNIGRVITIYNNEAHPFKVQYEKSSMSTKLISGWTFDLDNSRNFSSKEILYHSSNKEDLVIYISAKKYNI